MSTVPGTSMSYPAMGVNDPTYPWSGIAQQQGDQWMLGRYDSGPSFGLSMTGGTTYPSLAQSPLPFSQLSYIDPGHQRSQFYGEQSSSQQLIQPNAAYDFDGDPTGEEQAIQATLDGSSDLWPY
ncbi:uncharacterized protein L203_106137 [Cryptococcus depauperatus CBS 7841]|uniref:Uncharacterized protein n=1 Tax=Cryptococcus depauperatus CBS 7841 TaxID=1295531 RepID=A0A1E3IVI9_9TREE|nr:hypothetical protein L203_00847 [Cryptococcus depauperatus CBS 7841]